MKKRTYCNMIYITYFHKIGYQNKIGEHDAPICGVRPDSLEQMDVAYADNLGEPPAPDGEWLWNAEHHSDFPYHAPRSYSLHAERAYNFVRDISSFRTSVS